MGTVAISVHKLHDGQKRIAEHPARFKVVMAGRRYGKSALGIRMAMDAAIRGEPVAWFAPNYKYAAEAWRELDQRLSPIVQRKNEQERRMDLMGGGSLEVWTLDGPDPARGRKYAFVVIDEAGIVRDLLDLWQQAIRPTLVDLSGKTLFIGTPKGRRHGFMVLFNRGETTDPDWQSFRAPTMDNPYIPAEEIETAKAELPPEVFRQEFEGIPTDDGVNPFGLDAIAACVGPMSEDRPVVYGLDLARAIDYTVLVGLDAHMRVCFLDRWQLPWAETKKKVKHLVGTVPVVADATGVGDAIVADLLADDVQVTPHVFTQPSKLKLMQRLVACFQQKDLTIPDGWLARELETFEYVYTASGVKYEAPKGFHDDGVMALGLAVHGWDRVQGVKPGPVLATGWHGEDLNADPTRAPVGVGDLINQLPGEGW